MKLFNFYKNALRKLKKETKNHVKRMETATVSQQYKFTSQLKKAKVIDKIIEELVKDATKDVKGFVKQTAVDGFLGTLYDVEGKSKMNLEFNMLNTKYIDNLVNKKTVGKDISTRLHGYNNRLAEVVKQELLDGAINGEGYAKIAKRIEEQTEATYKESLNMARTEGKRVQGDTTQKGYEEAEELGVSIKKMWQSTLDSDTRDTHGDMDGQTVDIDEEFINEDGDTAMSPGDFGLPEEDCNCRCTTVTIVEGISPSLRRDNETKEVINYKNYDEWKEGKGV